MTTTRNQYKADAIFGGVQLRPGGWNRLRFHFFLPWWERKRYLISSANPLCNPRAVYFCETCHQPFTYSKLQPERCTYCKALPGPTKITCFEAKGNIIETFPFHVNSQRLAVVEWEKELA